MNDHRSFQKQCDFLYVTTHFSIYFILFTVLILRIVYLVCRSSKLKESEKHFFYVLN